MNYETASLRAKRSNPGYYRTRFNNSILERLRLRSQRRNFIEFRNSKYHKGFTLLEMVIYIAILTLIAVVVVNTVLSLAVSFNSLRATRDINNAAMVSLERMGRDIRGATGIDTGGSSFGSHPGTLLLIGAIETEFYLDDGVIKVREDDVEAGALTREAATTTNLVFYHISASPYSGIRIEMTLESTRGTITKTKSFSSFVALRSSY